MRGRGLKQLNAQHIYADGTSPPMRGRGLKRVCGPSYCGSEWSPPMRGRGLKRKGRSNVEAQRNVAPHAGARIETEILEIRRCGAKSRPPCGGAD